MAEQALRRRVHRRGVERLAAMPGPVALEGERRAPVDDAVEIAPPLAPRSARRNHPRPRSAARIATRSSISVRWALRASRTASGRQALREAHDGDLAGRMHAGIGAAGALDAQVLAAKGGDRLLDRLLHGTAIGLPLPADIGRAVILDRGACSVASADDRMPRRQRRAPCRNSSAGIGALPARCTSRRRTAPSPQAMVRPSSSTRPGRAAALAPGVERSTLTRCGPWPQSASNQAPGKGERPRIWSCTSPRRARPVDARLRLRRSCGHR